MVKTSYDEMIFYLIRIVYLIYIIKNVNAISIVIFVMSLNKSKYYFDSYFNKNNCAANKINLN